MTRLPDHWTWREEPLRPHEAVIVDVDGVLADASARQWHIDRRRPDWNGFFAGVADDLLLEEHSRLVRSLEQNIQVVLLTARPFTSREATLNWLERNDVRWDLLALRGPADVGVRALGWKRDSLHTLRRFGFRFLFALDDDPRIASMYWDEDLPCVYIHSGYYD